MKKYKNSTIILSVIILISLAFTLNLMPGKRDKTMFAIYYIGSDLEDDYDQNGIPDEKEQKKKVNDGAASNDMREMIKGYKSLTSDQKSNIKVLLAYGGARKKGWQGIKYTDMDCIIKDSKDNYFGNADCSSKVVPKANMGKLDTLKDFLLTVKEESEDCGKVIVEIADHGYSFYGIGPDMNYYDSDDDTLTLDDIRQAFLSSGLKPDMIGFDACLMGSMEVASSLVGITKYMVASEESEPSHGWNYGMIINYMGTDSDASVTDIGKYIVSSFIDSPAHKDTEFKTLSLLDLTKFNNVRDALEQLISALSPFRKYYESVLQAANRSEQYGKDSKGDPGLCIDLVHFIKRIEYDRKELLSQCYNALEKINDFVVFSQQDGTRRNANGIALYSPENLSIWTDGDYSPAVSFSTVWTSFLKKFMSYGSADSESPDIGEEISNAVIRPERYAKYSYIEPDFDIVDKPKREKRGKIFTITDNKGVRSASMVKGKYLSASKYMTIGMDELLKIGRNRYFIPQWNGSVLKIGNKGKEGLVMPAVFEDFLSDGNRIYSSEIYYNDESDAALYIKVNKKNNVVGHWVVPYDSDSDGNLTLSKDQYEISKGDIIQLYNEVIDFEKGTQEWKLGERIEFTSDPVFTKGRVRKDCFYFCMAEDLKGNIQEFDAFDVE